MRVIDQTHAGFVYPRRISQLSSRIAALLAPDAKVLDVGCGDGLLAFEISKIRPDVQIVGIDVLVRSDTFINVSHFNGNEIPYGNGSFDNVLLVDVLHHTVDPTVLLQEAARVVRNAIILKDHTKNGLFAGSRLRFMDWVGNARHGVVLPYNYWPRQKWRAQLEQLSLGIESWTDELDLYPAWANWMFGKSLHFLARLTPHKVYADVAERQVSFVGL